MAISAYFRRLCWTSLPVSKRTAMLIVILVGTLVTYQILQTIDDSNQKYPRTRYVYDMEVVPDFSWQTYTTIPKFVCPDKLISKVRSSANNASSESKYLCGIEGPEPCFIYSFSNENNSVFESELLRRTTCSLYLYNPIINSDSIPSATRSNQKFHMDKTSIVNEQCPNQKTLQTFMKENGHQWVDLISIDMPFGAYRAIERMIVDYRNEKALPVGQLIVKFRARESPFIMMLFEKMEEYGFRLFNKSICCGDQPVKSATFSFLNVKAIGKLFQKHNEPLFIEANKQKQIDM